MRKQEVSLFLKALKKKRKERRLWSENIILVGDFNFYRGAERDDSTIEMIREAGYREVESLIGIDTNASRTNAYDRMFLTNNENFLLGQSRSGLENGGVFNPFEHVFKEGEEATYKTYMKSHYTGTKDMNNPANQKKYFKHPWRKNQISDHFPIWCEMIIDSSPVFLERSLQSYS